MPAEVTERTKVISTTTGLSDFVLGAVFSSAWVDKSVLIDGETYDYVWESADGTEFETGRGVYTVSTSTLTRATVRKSSNGDAKVSAPAGNNTVSISLSDTAVNEMIAAPLRNAIINGCCRVKTRVNPASLSNTRTIGAVDRWQMWADGTVGAGSIAQAETTLLGSTGFALHGSGVTLTGAGKINIRTRLEADEVRRFRNKVSIFSLRCYHDIGAAKNLTIELRKADAKNDWSTTTQIAISGNISIADVSDVLASFSANLGECGNGLEINCVLDTGAVTTKNIYFTEMQLHEGRHVRPWQHVPYTEEYVRCARFTYAIYGLAASGYATVSGQTTRCNTTVGLPAPLFKTPTIDQSNATFSTGLVDGTLAFASVAGPTSLGVRMASTNSGSTFFALSTGFVLILAECLD